MDFAIFMTYTNVPPCTYLLENVQLLGDYWLVVLTRWKHIRAWINGLVHVNVAIVNSHAHLVDVN